MQEHINALWRIRTDANASVIDNMISTLQQERLKLLCLWAGWIMYGYDKPHDDLKSAVEFSKDEQQQALSWTEDEINYIEVHGTILT
jgi:hypothetical protein